MMPGMKNETLNRTWRVQNVSRTGIFPKAVKTERGTNAAQERGEKKKRERTRNPSKVQVHRDINYERMENAGRLQSKVASTK